MLRSCSRRELKTIVRPSGDQRGSKSEYDPSVTARDFPVRASITKMPRAFPALSV